MDEKPEDYTPRMVYISPEELILKKIPAINEILEESRAAGIKISPNNPLKIVRYIVQELQKRLDENGEADESALVLSYKLMRDAATIFETATRETLAIEPDDPGIIRSYPVIHKLFQTPPEKRGQVLSLYRQIAAEWEKDLKKAPAPDEQADILIAGIDAAGEVAEGPYFDLFRAAGEQVKLDIRHRRRAIVKPPVLSTGQLENFLRQITPELSQALIDTGKSEVQIKYNTSKSLGEKRFQSPKAVIECQIGLYDYSDKDKESKILFPRDFTAWDERLHAVIAGYKETGIYEVSLSSLWKSFGGQSAPDKATIKRLISRTLYLSSMPVFINESTESAAYYNLTEAYKYAGTLMHVSMQQASYSFNGKKAEYCFAISPVNAMPLFELEKRHRMTFAVPPELFHISGRKLTTFAIEAENALLKTIELMKKTRRDGTPYRDSHLYFDAIWGNWGNLSRRAQAGRKEYIGHVLTHYAELGHIQGYEKIRKNPRTGRESGINIII